MHTRVLIGVGAWLVGAGTATGGSLLAVSLLGQGFAAAPSQQLSVAAVNKALRGETGERSPATSPAAAASPPAISRAPTSSPRPARRRASSPPAPTPAAGTVLTSSGGTVVGRCQASGVYLQTWSPQQGYEVTAVARGPAPTAQVTFMSARKIVTMTVTCSQGVPSATTRARSTWTGDD